MKEIRNWTRGACILCLCRYVCNAFPKHVREHPSLKNTFSFSSFTYFHVNELTKDFPSFKPPRLEHPSSREKMIKLDVEAYLSHNTILLLQQLLEHDYVPFTFLLRRAAGFLEINRHFYVCIMHMFLLLFFTNTIVISHWDYFHKKCGVLSP